MMSGQLPPPLLPRYATTHKRNEIITLNIPRITRPAYNNIITTSSL